MYNNYEEEEIETVNTKGWRLDETSPRVKQPSSINIQLKYNQLACIYAMQEIEKSGNIIIDKPNEDSDLVKFIQRIPNNGFNTVNDITKSTFYLNTNSAILGDKVGSGKSLTILGLIKLNKTPPLKNRIISGTSFYSLTVNPTNEQWKTNLIVVPHGLINQWKKFIEMTDLSVYTIDKSSDIQYLCNKEVLETRPTSIHPDTFVCKQISKSQRYNRYLFNWKKINKLKIFDIILVNVNRYSEFTKMLKNIKWSRVVIDEMDTISLPMNFAEYGNFNWFVSATSTSVLQRHKKYISNIFGHNPWILEYFQIKSDEEFIRSSMGIPEPITYFIDCTLSEMIKNISHILPPNILELINAGNIDEATKQLNCNIETNESILVVIKKNLDRDLNNLKNRLTYTENQQYHNDASKTEAIDRIKIQIKDQEEKIKDLVDRVSNNLNEKVCQICCENLTHPILTTCCKNIFCFKCATNVLNHQSNKTCPYCRESFTKEKITIIKDIKIAKIVKKEENNNDILASDMNKNDILKLCVKEIMKNKKSRILIFSKYARSVDKLEDVISSLGMGCSVINGSSSHVNNLIESYNKGHIPILLMDAQNYGSGLNLQQTTHVIIYHRFSKELETQVIGRGQRFGRKDRLKIIYLTNETENHDIYFGKSFEIIKYKNEIKNIDILHLDPEQPFSVVINKNHFKKYFKKYND